MANVDGTVGEPRHGDGREAGQRRVHIEQSAYRVPRFHQQVLALFRATAIVDVHRDVDETLGLPTLVAMRTVRLRFQR